VCGTRQSLGSAGVCDTVSLAVGNARVVTMVSPLEPRQGRQDDGRTHARPARPLDAHVLRTLSLDLIGRPPFAVEVEEWSGKPVQAFLDTVLGSQEFWEHWYEEQLYYFLLIDNFRPATDSTRTIPAKLVEGRMSVRDALHRVALSSSFNLRNPGADTFVTVVMEQVVGLTVQKHKAELEIGKRVYDGHNGLFLGSFGENQSDVVRIAIESKAAARAFTAREFVRMTHREAPKKELAAWTRKLHKDPHTFIEVVREWLLSEAYEARLAHPVPLANRLFVRAVFVDLLGRLPEPAEAEPLRNALDGLSDSRPLRSVLVRLLLDSGSVPIPEKNSIRDVTEWVAGLFPRFLGREATPEELKAFVLAFGEPECRPKTILYAILSNAEYHTF